jgi:hypothetical protein
LRTVPKTALAQALWVVCILACLVMIFASAIAGLAVMITAMFLYAVGRIAGLR